MEKEELIEFLTEIRYKTHHSASEEGMLYSYIETVQQLQSIAIKVQLKIDELSQHNSNKD